jgi:transglutaminase-like putative cysteine protease
MERSATVYLAVEAASPASLILSMAVADTSVVETLTVLQAGRLLTPTEVLDQHGARLHVVDVAAGPVTVQYSVDKSGAVPAPESPAVDELRYLRPSRYCESDTLGPIARSEFAGLTGRDLLAGVSSWVGQNLFYVPGSSQPTDGAVATLLSRRGVCRDYAHLVIALLRALDVPARLVSVYAPGLDPMDFHAVAEAYIDDDWYVVDATTLAPRRTLMRIATGRDASDTAFLSTRGGAVSLQTLEVSAVSDVLPDDDLFELVRLG